MTGLAAVFAGVGIAAVTSLLMLAALWLGTTLAFGRAGGWGLLVGVGGAAAAFMGGIAAGLHWLL